MLRACMIAVALLTAGHLVAQDKEPPKPQNDKISDFIDNTAKYKGQKLTLLVEFAGGKNDLLTDEVGQKSVPFIGYDPANKAKLILGVEIPRGLTVPKARGGELVVVTFECGGKTDKGNVATSITRPTKPKKD
jgi:hypothetical protein